MVPLLTMGIPGSGATAIILAAFLLHGIQPGPQVFVSSTELVYTVFASVFVGVIGMCILGYFAIRPLCKVLEAPEAIVSAFVVVFCFVGRVRGAQQPVRPLRDRRLRSASDSCSSDSGSRSRRWCSGTILGPLTENNFMTTMVSFDNDWTVFFTRPISGSILRSPLSACSSRCCARRCAAGARASRCEFTVRTRASSDGKQRE